MGKSYVRSLVRLFIGERPDILLHIANDWLAACWFFYYCSIAWLVGSFIYIFISTTQRQDFIYSASVVDAFMFTIGSAYFIAGSYPLEESAGSKASSTVGDGEYIDTTNTMHKGREV